MEFATPADPQPLRAGREDPGRKKLGLGEHDKNIDGFIRSLMR